MISEDNVNESPHKWWHEPCFNNVNVVFFQLKFRTSEREMEEIKRERDGLRRR